MSKREPKAVLLPAPARLVLTLRAHLRQAHRLVPRQSQVLRLLLVNNMMLAHRAHRAVKDGTVAIPLPPERSRKRPADTSASAAAKKRQAARRDIFHIPASSLTPGEKKMQTSIHTHIFIMLGIFSMLDLPDQPAEHMLITFAKRFATADEWEAFEATLSTDHSGAMNKIRELRLAGAGRKGTIAANIAQVGEQHLQLIFSTILSAGLVQWRPDIIGGTFDSLYNLAHENIAINTFQQVAGAHGYVRIGPDLTRLRDAAFLRKLYRNCVYSMLRKRLLAERAEAGAVVARAKKTNTYKVRKSLGIARSRAILADGWPQGVAALVAEPYANSDDEFDSETQTYTIKPKNARGANATNFIRGTVDPGCKKMKTTQGQFRGRIRVIVPDAEPTKISERLPDDVPLDWFNPAVFNEYPARLRAKYRNKGIALPAARHWVNGQVPDRFKTMDDAYFMERYGNEVLALYRLPTDEEIAQMRENGEDPDESQNHRDDGEEDFDLDDDSDGGNSGVGADEDGGSGDDDFQMDEDEPATNEGTGG
ncbi:hypothetical protein DFH06DRAFT_1338433 [Mycena polygramma]|nr:hypothetical protein DFH06DRAFT_1338433 [Mycena polygramma]